MADLSDSASCAEGALMPRNSEAASCPTHSDAMVVTPAGAACAEGGAICAIPERASPQTPVPLFECLCLDRLADNDFVLTNILTGEKCMLAGEHELVIDEVSGDAVVLKLGEDDEEAQILEVRDLLSKVVVEDCKGCRYVQSASPDGSMTTLDLDAAMSKFKSASCHVSVGGGAAAFDFECFVFVRARGLGCRCWWSLNKIYAYLGLTCYKNFPGRWASRSKMAWKKQWLELAGDSVSDELVHAVDDRGQGGAIHALRFPQRCLPAPSLSTFAMLATLLRWYVCHQNKGGLTELGCRKAASSMMASLVTWVSSDASPLKIRLELVSSWSARWPRPPPPVDGRSVLELGCAAGQLDLAPVKELAMCRDPHPVASDMWSAVSEYLGVGSQVPLLQCMEVCMVNPKAKSLLGQLLMVVALRLELLLARCTKGGGGPNKQICLQWTDRTLCVAPFMSCGPISDDPKQDSCHMTVPAQYDNCIIGGGGHQRTSGARS